MLFSLMKKVILVATGSIGCTLAKSLVNNCTLLYIFNGYLGFKNYNGRFKLRKVTLKFLF